MTVALAMLTMAGMAVLAVAKGANDVSTGVATLAGTGRSSHRNALASGTVSTFRALA